jgi:hypothetical protein
VLPVPGGRAALEWLGVSSETPRALVLTELVRRLHFTNEARGQLEAAVTEFAGVVFELLRLQDAIAAASPTGTPLTLATAQSTDARRRIIDVVEAAGLRVRDVERRLVVEEDRGQAAGRLRARLARLGVDTEALRRRLSAGEPPALDVPSVNVPLPLSPQTWSRIFGREAPATSLFASILVEPSARLLYHGLAGMDAETRRWFGAQPDLLKQIYGSAEAVSAFALFAPAIRIRNAALEVPGSSIGARRWSAVLDTEPSRPDLFVARLFTRSSGRLAALYFSIASAEPERQAFLLGEAVDAAADAAFGRLASRFVACYESELPSYPFSIRFNDPALLLLEIGISPMRRALAGPRWRRFWSRALDGGDLPEDPARSLRDLQNEGTVDGSWLVAALCDAPRDARSAVLQTLLFANRVFGDVADPALPDVLVAVRARQLFPGLMSALEQAGISAPATYAHLARRAEQISRIEDAHKAISALQQFQGSVALTLAAVRAETLTIDAGTRLLEALAAIALENGRYGGTLAAWFADDWLTATGGPSDSDAATSAEERTLAALAGRSGSRDPVVWEGLTYALDIAGHARRQMRDARRRQRGITLDSVTALGRLVSELRAPSLTIEGASRLRGQLAALRTELAAFEPADEYLDDVPDITRVLDRALDDLARMTEPRRLSRARDVAGDLTLILDVLFGHAVASWAYALPLADAASQTIVGGGDPARRHHFGVRESHREATLRWEIAWRGEENGFVSGSLFGLDAALARRKLRRLTSDRLPGQPALDRNDVAVMYLATALSDPRRLTDPARDRIAAAIAAGAAAVARAGRDAAALDAAAAAAAISPWRRQALGWTAADPAEDLGGWFSSTELAWIGGLEPEEVDAWGTPLLPSGCLCIRMPRVRPEALLGRALAALRPYQSPGLMFRIASTLARHRLPAALATSIQRYAMQELIDRVRPAHAADFEAFARAVEQIDPTLIEDYISATAATGPLVERKEE